MKYSLPLVACWAVMGCSSLPPSRIPFEGATFPSQVKSAERPSGKEIVALIDRLVGFGEAAAGNTYLDGMCGDCFAPMPETGFNGLLTPVFAMKMREGPFAELVAAGIAAMPTLVAHLGDKRETKIKVEQGGFEGGVFYGEEYDRKQRTWKGEEERWKHHSSEVEEPRREYRVTVGDLCFVAIGQIVNRSFNAVRYQPTGCFIVNSTTRSESLRECVVLEWGNLNEEEHRKSLEADALTADDEERRLGALIRLSFYYPDAVDDVALRVLRLPCYDSFVAREFARKTLYEEADATRWKSLLEDYVSKRTPAFRDGVLAILLEDSDVQEEGPAKPRLDALFPKATRLAYLDSIEAYELARAIDALSWHRSSKVDDVVLALFRGLKGDGLFKDHSEDYLALACIRRLRRLGKYDAELAEYCRRRIQKAGPHKPDLKKALLDLEKQD